jgi:hypothetical protein
MSQVKVTINNAAMVGANCCIVPVPSNIKLNEFDKIEVTKIDSALSKVTANFARTDTIKINWNVDDLDNVKKRISSSFKNH